MGGDVARARAAAARAPTITVLRVMSQALRRNGRLPRVRQHVHEFANIVRVVVPGAASYEIPVPHTGFVDIRRATEFRIVPALGYSGHAFAANHIGGGDDLDAVTYARHRLAGGEEMPRNAHQVLVIAQILGRASA